MAVTESPKKERTVITFLVDHASPDAFFNLIDQNNAPYVTKYILGEKMANGAYSKAAICKNVVTGFPSTSANTHVSIMTGDYARKNDLLYTYYWNLLKKKPEYIDTDEITFSLLYKLNFFYINPACKTYFEYFKTSASFHAINRGATFRMLTTWKLLTKFLPMLISLMTKDDPNGVNPIARPEIWREYFLSNIGEFLTKIKREGIPQGNFIVFLLSDENAHKYGFDSEQYKESVQVLDFFVQSIVEGVKDTKGQFYPGLKDMGYADDVVWCICTDHAGRQVHRDKLVFINEMIDIECGLTLLEGLNDKRQRILIKMHKNYNKLTAFTNVGAEFWQAWFGGGKKKTIADYRRFYHEDHYRALPPNSPRRMKGFRKMEPVDIIEYLLKMESIQFVIIPEDEDLENGVIIEAPEIRIKKLIPRDYKIRIFSSEGVGLVERMVIDNVVHYSYSIVSGKDPLSYNLSGLAYNTPYNHEKWLEYTLKIENPDVFHRLFGYFDCVYAPNFIVTAKWEYSFQSLPQLSHKMRKAMLNVQTHDGLYGGESIVPLTIAGAGVKKGIEIPFARNIDILPSILNIMDIPFDEEIVDGKPIPNLKENADSS
jgi:predicted AlkP superfamily pyrophosphatase or phosphodiesterase